MTYMSGKLYVLLAHLLIALCVPTAGAETFVPTANGHSYYRFTIDENTLSGPPDQSTLNHALKPQDRLTVRGRHFYAVGTEGLTNNSNARRVRLFGANLSFGANFPAETEAKAYAKRLRKLGFNAVRLHHLDSHPGVEEQPRSILTTGPYPSFNPVAVKRLRTFITALAEEGIYINLNLRVGYRFRPSIDNLPELDDQQQQPASVGTPIHVYYPPLIQRQERYARELINLLGLRNNPALAMVEINNESSLLAAWQGDAWYGDTWHNAIPNSYASILQERWTQWLKQHYGSLGQACQAWNNCNTANPAALPTATIKGYQDLQPSLTRRIHNRLSRLGQEWGLTNQNPTSPTPKQRYKFDFLSFLAEMDREYLDRMKTTIQDAAGFPVPVTGTQITYGGILNLDSHENMDYIDDHVYIGHHVYANGNPWMSEDWRVPKISASNTGIARLFAMTLRRDASKPFVISEYNQPFPTPGSSEIMPIMVLVASLQDWDGLFFFGYDDSLPAKTAPWYFSLSGDWGKYALTGQSARLFRTFLIPALPTRIELPLTYPQRLLLTVQGHIRTQTLEKHLLEHYGVTIQSAWQAQLAQHVIPAATSILSPPTITASGSKTPDNSVYHNEEIGLVLLNTPHAWGIFGQVEDQHSQGEGDFRLRLRQPAQQAVQVLLTSLTQDKLDHTRHLLFSIGGDVVGSQPNTIPIRPKSVIPYPGQADWLTLEAEPNKKGPSGLLSATSPSWLMRSAIDLQLPYHKDTLTIYPLDGSGLRKEKLPEDALSTDVNNHEQTWVHLQTGPNNASPWYEILIHPRANSHSTVQP